MISSKIPLDVLEISLLNQMEISWEMKKTS